MSYKLEILELSEALVYTSQRIERLGEMRHHMEPKTLDLIDKHLSRIRLNIRLLDSHLFALINEEERSALQKSMERQG